LHKLSDPLALITWQGFLEDFHKINERRQYKYIFDSWEHGQNSSGSFWGKTNMIGISQKGQQLPEPGVLVI